MLHLTTAEIEMLLSAQRSLTLHPGVPYETYLTGVQDYLQEKQDNGNLSNIETSLLNKINQLLKS